MDNDGSVYPDSEYGHFRRMAGAGGGASAAFSGEGAPVDSAPAVGNCGDPAGASGDGGTDGGGTGADFFKGSHRNGLTGPGSGGNAENALRCIAHNGAESVSISGTALQLPWFAALSGDHGSDVRIEGTAPLHGQQGALRVVDTVAQGSEMSRFRVIIGNGADACNALPQVNAKPGTVGGDLRREYHSGELTAPADGQRNVCIAAAQSKPHILCAADGSAVNLHDLVTDL